VRGSAHRSNPYPGGLGAKLGRHRVNICESLYLFMSNICSHNLAKSPSDSWYRGKKRGNMNIQWTIYPCGYHLPMNWSNPIITSSHGQVTRRLTLIQQWYPTKIIKHQDKLTTGRGSPTWWLILLSKWVITPVINGISRVNPLITGVITHLLSGMSHQVVMLVGL